MIILLVFGAVLVVVALLLLLFWRLDERGEQEAERSRWEAVNHCPGCRQLREEGEFTLTEIEAAHEFCHKHAARRMHG